MIIKKILLTLTFFSLIFCGGKVGTSIFRWAEIQTGTRAIGMGGAQVASGNEISALPYNPASVCFIEKSQIFSSVSKI